MSAEQLVSYSDPPVIETVLGVQFEPLSGLTAGHVGWYWRSILGDSWNSIAECGKVPEQVERFGKHHSLRVPRLGLKLQTQPESNRLQIKNDSGGRMLQIQDNRFLYNWIKKSESYPRYSVVRSSFDAHFEQFCQFVSDEGLGTIKLNQWEVTYVNRVPSGPLWKTPLDWGNVVPGLLSPVSDCEVALFENMT